MSKKIFDKNPHLDVVYVTSDKVKFYTKHHAEMHAKNLKNKEIKKLEKSDFLEEKKTTKLKVDERIAFIDELTEVAEIEAFVKNENSEKVIEFALKKIEELKKQ